MRCIVAPQKTGIHSKKPTAPRHACSVVQLHARAFHFMACGMRSHHCCVVLLELAVLHNDTPSYVTQEDSSIRSIVALRSTKHTGGRIHMLE